MTEKECIEKLKIFPKWNRDDLWLNDGDMEDLVNSCVKALEEIQQYRAIGTVEECRQARERQIGKKPILYKGTNRADCPVCGNTVRGINKPFGDWCSCCGQKLDWSE